MQLEAREVKSDRGMYHVKVVLTWPWLSVLPVEVVCDVLSKRRTGGDPVPWVYIVRDQHLHLYQIDSFVTAEIRFFIKQLFRCKWSRWELGYIVKYLILEAYSEVIRYTTIC